MNINQFRILSDLILIALGIGLRSLLLTFTPTRRGFYCDDESIQYPYNGDTVSRTLMDLIFYLAGFILIIPTEYALGRNNPKGRKYLSGFMVPEWLCSAYRLCVDYIVAALLLNTANSVFKIEVGSLRPSFIQRCRPNIDFSNCAAYNHTYITDYECQNGEHPESRFSFPSGHSTSSAFVSTFWIIYIQVKWVTSEESPFRLWKHIVQGVVGAASVYISQSRYMDNLHHPIDIIFGYGLGVVVAIFTAIQVCRLTSSPTANPESHPLMTART